MENAFSKLVVNLNLLNEFFLQNLKKFWIFILKPDLIPKLHLLKLNVLVKTMVTMCIVEKVKDNLCCPKDIGNHH